MAIQPYRERLRSLVDMGHELGATTVRGSVQGNVFKIAVRSDAVEHRGGGVRGPVVGFSAGSRKRLLEKLARCEMPENGSAQFWTFTYHDDFPDCNGARANLRALLERVRRRWSDSTAFWRLELQDRGAPHFHLVVLGVPDVGGAWLLEQWRGVTGDSTITQVDAKTLDGWRAVRRYVSKYVSKPTEDQTEELAGVSESVEGGDGQPLDSITYLHAGSDTMGRVWGVFNGGKLPFAVMQYFEWDRAEWLPKLKRAVKGFRRACVRAGASRGWRITDGTTSGLLLFCDNPARWLDLALLLSL